MVNFNRVFKLSIPRSCACSFRIARSYLGIKLSFTPRAAFAVRGAGNEASAIVVESVHAKGAVRAISLFVVVICYEIRIKIDNVLADVLPGCRANCPYAFPPGPTVRVLTIVLIIWVTDPDVVIDMCLSRLSSRRSGCCRDVVKDEEDTSEPDKDFVEHCNVALETCGVWQGKISLGLN